MAMLFRSPSTLRSLARALRNLACTFVMFGAATAQTGAQDGKQNASMKQVVTFETTDEGVWFRQAGKPIAFYQAAPKSLDGQFARANYLHPLYDLRGKQVLTEDFPEDHRHHRGVFWAWHQTLADGKRMGDAWTAKRFGWRVTTFDAARKPNGAAELKAVVHWTSPDFGSDEPFAAEHVKLTVFPLRKKARLLDFQIRIESLVDELQLGGSEDVKGYGGFSIRVVCPPDLAFESEEGALEPKTGAVPGGDWLNLRGRFGERSSSVAVLTDTRAPGPQDWILRRKRSMQNPRYPGRELITVKRGEPLQLHYGLVIHQDKDVARIPQWRNEFLKQQELPPSDSKSKKASDAKEQSR